MSSFEGDSLEEWVEEMYARCNYTPESFAKIVALHEPVREEIERSIENFHAQEDLGWRSWYSYSFDFIPKEIKDAADQIIAEQTKDLP